LDVFTAISNRRSIREYRDIEVEEEKINKILEAARLAPSAANRQKWKFIVVTDKEIRQSLVKAANGQKFIEKAPLVLVACSTESETVMPCGQYAYTVDLSIAVSFMILEAVELGLGTCWLGAFNENEVKNVLEIPPDIRVVAIATIGYPDEKLPQRFRKTLDQIVCFEKYE
jgi:nitroreductase